MITIQELFNTLSYGELLNLSITDTATGAIDEGQYPKLVSHLNLGLTELYKRFNLLQDEINLHQYAGVYTYYLRSDRVGLLTDMNDSVYLEEETTGAFKNNIVKVLQAYDAEQVLITMNDQNDTEGVTTLSHDILRFKEILTPQIVSLVYQAYYPKITVDATFDPETYELYIPGFIEEALIAYIGSRMYKPVGGNSSTVDADKSTSFLQLYELSCAKIESLGLDTQMSQSNNTFENNGWV